MPGDVADADGVSVVGHWIPPSFGGPAVRKCCEAASTLFVAGIASRRTSQPAQVSRSWLCRVAIGPRLRSMAPFPTHRLLWLGSLTILGLALGHWLYHYMLFTRTLDKLIIF